MSTAATFAAVGGDSAPLPLTVPYGARGGVTVVLPEPADLARLLARPRPPARERWEQPILFELAEAGC